jgi:cobalt/nickel transport system permease protein
MADLPDWLSEAGPSAYDPPSDREGFLRGNVLRLAGALAGVRAGGSAASAVDRALGRVPAALRLLGLVVVVGCVSAATNALFVWVVLAIVLCQLALRPPRRIAAVAGTALAAAALAALLALPAVPLGAAPPSSVVRMAGKTFVSVSLVLGLTQGVAWGRLTSALASLRLPGSVTFVLDAAVRDVALLGRGAMALSEALALRSVGRNDGKAASAAGVMGVAFSKASGLASRQAEAMACRGFDGTYPVSRERVATPAGIAYVAGVVALVALFAWLEHAMAVAA